MAILKKISSPLNYAFWLAILLCIWVAFAPTQAGGLASYVIIIGKSMEPKFHIGDLVIIHKEPQYNLGDAVAYQNKELNSFVFHRIVSQSLGEFALQGDNNSWVDTDRPTNKEIIGKLWLHIPRGGIYMQRAQNPAIMAIIAGLLGVVLTSSLFGSKKDKGSMNKKESKGMLGFGGPPRQKPDANQLSWGGFFENSFFALGLIAFISIIVAIISFFKPATITVDSDIPYGQLGFYSYSAPAPQNIYDNNSIKTGDPIFPKLTCIIDINFKYTFVSTQAENITGTHQMTAKIIEAGSGWQRTISLQKETAFNGVLTESNVALNLCEIERLIQTVEESTEFHPATYLLEINPNVKVTGRLAGQEFEDEFNPKLSLLYDRLLYHVVENDEGNSFNPSSSEVVREKRTQEALLSFFGIGLRVKSLRIFSLVGLGISILGMILLGLVIRNMDRTNPASLIRLKYDSLLADVQDNEPNVTDHLVNVASIDTLAKLAERYNLMILHAIKGNSHIYSVQKDGNTYQFILNSGVAESGIPEEEAKN